MLNESLPKVVEWKDISVEVLNHSSKGGRAIFLSRKSYHSDFKLITKRNSIENLDREFMKDSSLFFFNIRFDILLTEQSNSQYQNMNNQKVFIERSKIHWKKHRQTEKHPNWTKSCSEAGKLHFPISDLGIFLSAPQKFFWV